MSNNKQQQPTRRRKSFKSETLRLTTTTVDVVDSVGKAMESTANLVVEVNSKLITPLIEASSEYLIDALKTSESEKHLEFYEDNVDMYRDLYGDKLGRQKLIEKIESL